MLTHVNLFALCGAVLFGIGLFGTLACGHLVRRVIALNVMSTSVFLIMIALSIRTPDGSPDFVPHAMVLTGIVVSLSATALALSLIRRLFRETGQSELPDVLVFESAPRAHPAADGSGSVADEGSGLQRRIENEATDEC
jgi:multicomponent Na+:H+ antiporter subunit C